MVWPVVGGCRDSGGRSSVGRGADGCGACRLVRVGLWLSGPGCPGSSSNRDGVPSRPPPPGLRLMPSSLPAQLR